MLRGDLSKSFHFDFKYKVAICVVTGGHGHIMLNMGAALGAAFVRFAQLRCEGKRPLHHGVALGPNKQLKNINVDFIYLH